MVGTVLLWNTFPRLERRMEKRLFKFNCWASMFVARLFYKHIRDLTHLDQSRCFRVWKWMWEWFINGISSNSSNRINSLNHRDETTSPILVFIFCLHIIHHKTRCWCRCFLLLIVCTSSFSVIWISWVTGKSRSSCTTTRTKHNSRIYTHTFSTKWFCWLNLSMN